MPLLPTRFLRAFSAIIQLNAYENMPLPDGEPYDLPLNLTKLFWTSRNRHC